MTIFNRTCSYPLVNVYTQPWKAPACLRKVNQPCRWPMFNGCVKLPVWTSCFSAIAHKRTDICLAICLNTSWLGLDLVCWSAELQLPPWWSSTPRDQICRPLRRTFLNVGKMQPLHKFLVLAKDQRLVWRFTGKWFGAFLRAVGLCMCAPLGPHALNRLIMHLTAKISASRLDTLKFLTRLVTHLTHLTMFLADWFLVSWSSHSFSTDCELMS